MSLNRYEQAVFDHWATHPDELRHWRGKVADATRAPGASGEIARNLERELWGYFVERSPHVPRLRELSAGNLPRVSFLNLSEHILRLWGPPPKSPRPPDPTP